LHHIASRRIASHRLSSHRLSSHRIASLLIASYRLSSHRIASLLIASHRIASHRRSRRGGSRTGRRRRGGREGTPRRSRRRTRACCRWSERGRFERLALAFLPLSSCLLSVCAQTAARSSFPLCVFVRSLAGMVAASFVVASHRNPQSAYRIPHTAFWHRKCGRTPRKCEASRPSRQS
jgi:hypothetical protein